MSVSEIKTPWSVVRPFVGFLEGSEVTFWRSATLAVWPVAEVNASFMAPMVEDMVSNGGGQRSTDARHGERTVYIAGAAQGDSRGRRREPTWSRRHWPITLTEYAPDLEGKFVRDPSKSHSLCFIPPSIVVRIICAPHYWLLRVILVPAGPQRPSRRPALQGPPERSLNSTMRRVPRGPAEHCGKLQGTAPRPLCKSRSKTST